MKIELTELKENPDGSADLSFSVDKEGMEMVVSFGVERMLLLAIENAQVKPIPDEPDAR